MVITTNQPLIMCGFFNFKEANMKLEELMTFIKNETKAEDYLRPGPHFFIKINRP